jgi:hypothetical protein
MRTDGVADVEGDARRPVGVVHLLDLRRWQAPPVVAAHLVLLPLPAGRGRRRRQGGEDDDERDEAERRCRSHAWNDWKAEADHSDDERYGPLQDDGARECGCGIIGIAVGRGGRFYRASG